MAPSPSNAAVALAAHAWSAGAADGDFADPDGPPHPGRGIPDRPWTWLHQVHGATVVTVTRPGQHAGAEADGAVTATPGAALVIRTADCAPVALLADGVVGLAHAGWRGLMAGVIEATVDAMRALGAVDMRAELGPCISPTNYAFGADDLAAVAARLGPEVRATTIDGRPALDLRAAVRAALARAGVDRLHDTAGMLGGACTAAAEGELFSHRARGDTGRQATFTWLAP